MAAPTVCKCKRAVLSIHDKVKIIEMLDKFVSYGLFGWWGELIPHGKFLGWKQHP